MGQMHIHVFVGLTCAECAFHEWWACGSHQGTWSQIAMIFKRGEPSHSWEGGREVEGGERVEFQHNSILEKCSIDCLVLQVNL